MKTYIKGIVYGIISILSSFTMVGIPIGTSPVEVIELLIFVLGTVILLLMALKMNNDNVLITATVIYVLSVFVLMAIIESFFAEFTLLAVGFIPGAAVASVGLIRSIKNKASYKIKASLIVNIIGIVVSLCSLCLVIPNGGFVIQ